MAVLGLPLVFAATGLGIGLFIERLLGARLPNSLLIPMGTCGAIVLSLGVYSLHLGVAPAVTLVLMLTVAGAVLARGGLRSRLNPGWPGLAGLAAYVLFVAPELLTGHWTWSGYNFLNDTATQFVLIAHLKAHGMASIGGLVPRSTTTEFVQTYLQTAYPLGAQAHLATLSGLLHTGPEVLYQGYLAALAGVTAVSLSTLAGRLLDARMAALGGLVGVSASLTYQFALQGSIKEMGTVATCTAALAIARHVVYQGIDVRGAVMAAVPLAALLDVFYSAAIPFVGAVALVAVVGAFLVRRRPPDRRMAGALLLAVVTTFALAAPSSASIATSFRAASSAFVSGTAPSLGQLARPLPLSQISGIWLSGDYRLPILAQPAGTLTAVLTALVFVLAVVGAVLGLRAREFGPAALLVAMGLVLAVVVPTVTPYAASKALAITSPAFAFDAFVGAAALFLAASRMRGVKRMLLRGGGLAAGACIAVSVLASDVIAYHHDNVAPTQRMLAIRQVAAHIGGRGPILWNEFEEYAKYFAIPAQINVPFETLTPRQVELVHPTSFYGQYFDLDLEQLSYLESFPVIVTRRSPSASRPPANFRLIYANRYYEAWARQPHPVILRHLASQLLYSAAEPVSCRQVSNLVSGTPRNSELIAAVSPFAARFDPRGARHPPGWPIDAIRPEALATLTPGSMEGTIPVLRSGRYRIWVQGDFPRPVTVQVDGRALAMLDGLDSVNQWSSAGVVRLTQGSHSVRVIRPGGRLGPGDGAPAYVGPVALIRDEPERLQRVSIAHWRSLCGRRLDWIELITA
jgi:hypothetical protein